VSLAVFFFFFVGLASASGEFGLAFYLPNGLTTFIAVLFVLGSSAATLGNLRLGCRQYGTSVLATHSRSQRQSAPDRRGVTFCRVGHSGIPTRTGRWVTGGLRRWLSSSGFGCPSVAAEPRARLPPARSAEPSRSIGRATYSVSSIRRGSALPRFQWRTFFLEPVQRPLLGREGLRRAGYAYTLNHRARRPPTPESAVYLAHSWSPLRRPTAASRVGLCEHLRYSSIPVSENLTARRI